MSKLHDHHLEEAMLYQYLDGAMSQLESREIETHIASCSRCLTRTQELQDLFETLEAWPNEPLTKDLAPAVMAAIQSRRDLSMGFKLVIVTQLLALAALIISQWASVIDALEGLMEVSFGAQLKDGVNAVFTILSHAWTNARVGLNNILVWGPNHDGLQIFQRLHLDGWLMIGVAALLWMVGNGLLLRGFPSNSTSHRRPQSGIS